MTLRKIGNRSSHGRRIAGWIPRTGNGYRTSATRITIYGEKHGVVDLPGSYGVHRIGLKGEVIIRISSTAIIWVDTVGKVKSLFVVPTFVQPYRRTACMQSANFDDTVPTWNYGCTRGHKLKRQLPFVKDGDRVDDLSIGQWQSRVTCRRARNILNAIHSPMVVVSNFEPRIACCNYLVSVTIRVSVGKVECGW